MDAPQKPKMDDVKYCMSCGQTTHHVRRNEEDPWTCVFCGAVEKKKKNNGDGHHGTD